MYRVATVGSFDGVHSGHASLIATVCRRAAEMGGTPIVITFDPHPRLVLEKDSALRLLCSNDEKRELLQDLGIKEVEMVHFDLEFSRLSREQFVERYIVGLFHVNELVVGYNHRFGYGNGGDYDYLSTLNDLKVSMVGQQKIGDEKISSTIIRELVLEGRMEHAARLLGHPYLLIGEADDSGFVSVCERKLLPPSGIYSCRVDGMSSEIEIKGNLIHLLDSRARGRLRIDICSLSRRK